MLPATTERVPAHTPQDINERLRYSTERNIGCFISASGKHIDERLRELDREWDIERALELNASVLSLVGVFMSVVSGKRWLLLPSAVAGFLMQHALQGWCPPLSLLRRFGYRTRREIDRERNALKMLRGDFRNVPDRAKPGEEQAAELVSVQER